MDSVLKFKKAKLNDQSLDLLRKLLDYMKEKEQESEDIPSRLSKVNQRIADATGLSARTINRIIKERKDIDNGLKSGFSAPLQNRKSSKPKTGINDDEKRMLRTITHNFYISHKMVPNCKQIHKEFVEATGYIGSEKSIYRVLKEMGFYWKSTKSSDVTKRRILLERADVKLQRVKYLKALKQYREENRTVVFMDETYLLPQQASEKSWSGQRLIIVHAFCHTGCIPNACLIFQSKSKCGDYHGDMNYENYKRWLTKKLIPNLPENSVVVMGNSPFQNVIIDEFPNYFTKKELTLQWLRSRNILCTGNMCRVELHNLVKLNKPDLKSYQIDELFLMKGHDVLRMPPFVTDLNPNELVWSSLKQYVSQSYVTYELGEVINLADDFLKNFSCEEWMARYQYVQELENEYLRREIALDVLTDQLITDLGIDEDTDEDDVEDIEEVDDEVEDDNN